MLDSNLFRAFLKIRGRWEVCIAVIGKSPAVGGDQFRATLHLLFSVTQIISKLAINTNFCCVGGYFVLSLSVRFCQYRIECLRKLEACDMETHNCRGYLVMGPVMSDEPTQFISRPSQLGLIRLHLCNRESSVLSTFIK